MNTQKHLQTLWRGRCSVWENQKVTNPANGRTESRWVAVYDDLPCRLSYRSAGAAMGSETVAGVSQEIKLFLDKAHEIRPGSRFDVTQNGSTERYKSAGQPALYSNHQEVILTLSERWA